MTPHDHNKTLGIIFTFLGGLLAAGAIVELVRVVTVEKELERIRSEYYLVIIGLLLMVMLLFTAYGVFKRRRWARTLAFILAGLFILLFPLGTALAVYTWWFMFCDGAKQMYMKSTR
jgi:hypothetical protein